MSVPETEIIDEWLYDTLTGDATLMNLVEGVYNEEAPVQTELPIIIFQTQSNVDVRNAYADMIFENSLYVVRGVVPGASFTPLRSIASRINDLLHQSEGGTTPDGNVWASVREEVFRQREQDRGIAYRHLGGIYRIWATAN